jgi:hypothetical protein
MKKSELQQIIKEEISKVLNENKTYTFVLQDMGGKVVNIDAPNMAAAGEKVVAKYPKSDAMLTHENGVEVKWDRGPIRPSTRYKVREDEDKIQTAFTKAITKDGDVKLGGSGARNIMRPKLIDIMFTDNQRYYKTLVDGKRMGLSDTEDLIKNLTGVDMTLNRMDDEKLEDVAKILKSKNIKLNWSDVFDPS